MRKLRGRLTYANVIATLALFIALGGVSYAATQLPKNSVGSKQLRKGAVRTNDIRNQAVTLRKIKAATRAALRGNTGPRGAEGPAGTFGSVVTRWVEFTVSPESISGQKQASCQAGERAVGGGVGFINSPGSGDRLVYTGPGVDEGLVPQGATPTSWEGAIYNSEAGSKPARVWVICVS